MTDQQRYDAVGWSNPYVRTPNLDGLSRRSIICNSAYVQSPQCQPSRASFLTGKYPTAHQVWWNQVPLHARHMVLPQHLVGYHTAWFGKLDLMRRGQFDVSYTFEDWRRDCKPEANWEFDAAMGHPAWIGEYHQDRSVHHEDVITERALAHLSVAPSPWFVGASFYGPHPPYAAPAPFSHMYDPATVPLSRAILEGNTLPNDSGYVLSRRDWQHLVSQYYGQISWIDDNIGRLLRAVPEDTLVVFTSDHGDILGDHGLFSKGVYAYEGNTRVPLLLRLPGHSCVQYDGLVQAIDVLPTLLEHVGLPISPGIQGRSLSGPFQGWGGNEWALSMIGRSPRLRMLRTGHYKYWVVGREETVFDLSSDPGEEVNLVGNGELLGWLRGVMVRALIDAEDYLPFPSRPG